MTDPVKTLLLVEDHEIVAALEMRQLNALGYDVIHVSRGEKAIEEVFRNGDAIDLILMDVDLGPSMAGTTAAQVILSAFDLPIIFLTSHVEREVVETTEMISAYGYVLKSSGIFVLSAAIKMAFKLHAALTELKKNEIFRRANERREKFTFDHRPLAVIKWNPDLIVSHWSDEAERIFGHSAQEVIGKSLTSMNLISLEDIPVVYRNISKMICGEEHMLVFTNVNYTKSGEAIRCTWYNTVQKDVSGSIQSVMSLIQEQTERPSEILATHHT
jgi:PAS domain S-box-containing protein